MTKIRILDDHTINKIAAGEVIENPSSVVKEMVENALDAKATEICVEIRGGGRQMIRITDNGCGMSRDDALLSLERHATSKIRDVEDLSTVETMGFRGEAVPSIASISKFMLLTNDSEDSDGTMILIEGGKVLQTSSAVRSKGTTMEIKSLFFNIPVRKKFQRSPTYDSNEIQKVITMQALAHPEVKFELVIDQKAAITAPIAKGETFNEKLNQRIGDVLGKEFSRGLTPVNYSSEGYEISGAIGVPTFTRQNRTGQHLFINNRAIVAPVISYAVRDGYGTALPANRHPVWVLHIKMAGELVDVNVHPQKREVRMRQQQELRGIIVQAVTQSVQQSGGSIVSATEESIQQPGVTTLPATEEYVILDSMPRVTPKFEFHEEIAPLLPDRPQTVSQPAPQPVFQEMKKATPRLIGTIQRYLIVDPTTFEEAKPGIALVDQRAAHSRVIFERLSKSQSDIAVQKLLIPFTIQLTPTDSDALREQLPTLETMGIQLQESGPNTFMIESIPQIFGNSDLQELLQDIIHRIRDFHDGDHLQKEVKRQVALAASRAAMFSNKTLSTGEGQLLLEQLMQCETPLQCPQGKPTLTYISQDELTRKFEG